MSNEPPVRPLGELRTSGLLWLLNASALHPRGVAIGLAYGPDGEVTGWCLYGNDDDTPWTFLDDEETHERYRAANTTIAAVGGH